MEGEYDKVKPARFPVIIDVARAGRGREVHKSIRH